MVFKKNIRKKLISLVSSLALLSTEKFDIDGHFKLICGPLKEMRR